MVGSSFLHNAPSSGGGGRNDRPPPLMAVNSSEAFSEKIGFTWGMSGMSDRPKPRIAVNSFFSHSAEFKGGGSSSDRPPPPLSDGCELYGGVSGSTDFTYIA